MCCIKDFKRKLLLIAVYFTAINNSFAQSYFHSPNDTIIANAIFDDISVFNITQVHPTSDTIYLKWHKQSVVMPLTWEASICDNGNCYTTLKDSGMMAPIVPGDNGLLSLHINPKFESGTGIIRYTIFAVNTPLQVDTLTWIITANATTSILETENIHPIVYAGYRQIICKNLNGNYSKALLFDISGKLLFQMNIQENEIHIPTQDYNPQLLILHLKGKQSFTTKILNN